MKVSSIAQHMGCASGRNGTVYRRKCKRRRVHNIQMKKNAGECEETAVSKSTCVETIMHLSFFQFWGWLICWKLDIRSANYIGISFYFSSSFSLSCVHLLLENIMLYFIYVNVKKNHFETTLWSYSTFPMQRQ